MTFHSTRTVPPGSIEVGAGFGQSLLGSPSFLGSVTEGTLIGRTGITSNLDIGLRLRSDFVLGGELKLRFVQAERLQMAVAPGAYFSLLAPAFNGLVSLAERFFDVENIASAFAYELHVPLLFGVPFQEHLFIFGPKLSFTNWNIQALVDSDGPLSGSSVSQVMLVPGVVVGLDLLLPDGRRVQPELNVHFDLFGTFYVQAGAGVFW